MAFLKAFLLLGFLALTSLSQAQQVMSFVKGSFSDIQNEYRGQPYLVLFWAQDCTYCMKELAILSPILKDNPNVKLITVATDPFLNDTVIRATMQQFDLLEAEHWVFADAYPEKLYFDVEKRWRGELPLTYLSDGQTLVRKSGLLKQADIATWLNAIK